MFRSQDLSKNIKKFREAKGYSQNALAQILMISPQSVSKWECGKSLPDIENICAMAELFNVSTDTLLGHTCNQKKMMLGIDGGGSKTEFVLFSEDGTILGKFLSKGCNPNVVGISACADILKDGINNLLDIQSVCAIYIGCAGFLTNQNGDKVKAILKKAYPHIDILCKTDITNVIATATDKDSCIAAICGTGSVVCAKEKEQLTPLGGWGYLLSDGGSGFDIGRDALFAALQSAEGLGEKTQIYEFIENKAGMPISELIGEVYKHDISYIASFAPAVFKAYEKVDTIAEKILQKNAKALAVLINHAAKHYQCGNNVIISGGLIGNNPFFADMLKQYLDSPLSLILPKDPQVLGACFLAARMCGKDTPKLRENLIEQYGKERKLKSC